MQLLVLSWYGINEDLSSIPYSLQKYNFRSRQWVKWAYLNKELSTRTQNDPVPKGRKQLAEERPEGSSSWPDQTITFWPVDPSLLGSLWNRKDQKDSIFLGNLHYKSVLNFKMAAGKLCLLACTSPFFFLFQSSQLPLMNDDDHHLLLSRFDIPYCLIIP